MEANTMDASQQQAKLEARIHYMASCIAGFFGVFPILNMTGIFGSAQTANLIETVLAVLTGDRQGLVMHGIGVLLYVGAIVLATIIPKHTKCNLRIVAMVVDTITAIVMWQYPDDLPVLMYLYPTFFAMAFHWCAFSGAYGFVSASIFSTNNLRMFISAMIERYVYGNKQFELKAKFFGFTLLSFHIGVVINWFCWQFLGDAGFLTAIILVALCTTQILKSIRMAKRLPLDAQND